MSSTDSTAWVAYCLNWMSEGCCSTNDPDPESWLTFDMGVTVRVSKIKIYNSATFQERLTPWEVWVSSLPQPNATDGAQCGNGSTPVGDMLIVSCAEVLRGRYVTLLLRGTDRILNITGMHVVGTYQTGSFCLDRKSVV